MAGGVAFCWNVKQATNKSTNKQSHDLGKEGFVVVGG